MQKGMLLYTFIDGAYLNGRTPRDVAKALVDGGSDIIQLRLKKADAAEVRRVAEEVLPLTQAVGVPLVINDFPDVAEAVGAEFVHLGQEDFFDNHYTHVSEVIRNRRFRVGLSSHAPEQALAAVRAGAAYLGVGPVFPTQTKPTATPVTLEYVRWASHNLTIPWFAIGGINLDNLGQVLDAGASGICVVSDILNAPDIAARCQQYKKRMSAG